MSIRLSTVIALIILLLPVTSPSADSTSRASQFFGCWEVSRMDWKPEPKQEHAPYLAVPQQMVLSGKPAVRNHTYILLPADGQQKTVHDDNYWQLEPNGGIRLSWRAAEAGKGVEIILEPPRQGEKAMGGIARAAFDIKVPQMDEQVVLYWCPGR